jgi:hypothetical protein
MATRRTSRVESKRVKRTRGASRAASGTEAVKIIDAYLRAKNPQLKDLANELRRTVRKTAPASREGVNSWGIPTFDFHGPFGLLMVGKRQVTFGFTRGTSLSDPTGLLEGTGKNLRHIKLETAEQLRDGNLDRLILEAAALNRETPMTPSMRVKKTT